MIYVGLHISDIHINPVNYERIINELRQEFIYRVKNYSKLDYITINGDLLDYELSLNSPASKAIITFMDDLIHECINRNIKIRLIKGTQFHDNNQLRIFLKYESYNNLDFKLIETVTEEELFPKFKVLYVPEEYVKSIDEHYGEFLNKDKEYNAIFGHGMFKEVSFNAKKQETGITMHNAPTFDSKIFKNICKGFVSFGHIHTPTVIKNFIYYTGSFSSLNFGEEHNKGFTLSTYDTDNDSFNIEFIINKLAPIYKTYILNDIENIDSIDEYLYKLENHDYDKLRIIINFKNSNDKEKSHLEIFKNYFINNKNVTLLIKNNIIDNMRKDEKIAVQGISDKYSFLTEEVIPVENKLQKYIKAKYDTSIDLDKIKDYLNL